MAGSIQDIVNAAHEVKEATKPLAQTSSLAAAELGKANQELAAATQGNRNSGPAAIHAVDQAARSLDEVHRAINSMNSALDQFVQEQMSK
jgi:ABC-type transporter Mla subunit MlaD